MHSTAPIRVLIADDLPELRTLLRTTLQGRGLQLVGEADDGHQTWPWPWPPIWSPTWSCSTSACPGPTAPT
jgi:CheY-like chemotaxis protein